MLFLSDSKLIYSIVHFFNSFTVAETVANLKAFSLIKHNFAFLFLSNSEVFLIEIHVTKII